MKLIITEDKRISDVQAAFNHLFPYLKLQFFRGHTNLAEPIRILKPDSTIGDITYGLQEGSVYLSDNMTPFELEEILDARFGLHVEVFRKSGDTWLETTTNKWTLKEQNDYGREVSTETYEEHNCLAD
ncbi:MAG TPA: hypothetical protein VFZ47_12820 [Chitinophagaceae bacterium]